MLRRQREPDELSSGSTLDFENADPGGRDVLNEDAGSAVLAFRRILSASMITRQEEF
jgi:hypothetical protein